MTDHYSGHAPELGCALMLLSAALVVALVLGGVAVALALGVVG